MGASGCDPRPMRGRASGGETCHAMCASCTYISSTEPKSETSRHCLALRPPHKAPTICNNRASVLAPLPPRALAFLDGPTDEHRVAGLLLLAAADASSLQAHASEIAAKLEASNFLARLLKTAGDDGAALTSAQRAGLEVARALAGTSDDVRDALAHSKTLEACGACVLSVADARTMAARACPGS